jgi:ribose transport system substrate-binding protein
VAVINGDEVPETIDTGFYWCDETNFEDEETQAVLYE